MNPTSTTYQIDVTGQLNPAIHDLRWYQAQQIVSAGMSGQGFRTPQDSRLNINGIQIQCTSSRWTAQTKNLETLDETIAIASRVFDELLKHTPLTSLGFCVNTQFEKPGANVAKVLASRLAQAGIADKEIDGVGVQFTKKLSPQSSWLTIIRTCSTAHHLHVDNRFEFAFKREPTAKPSPDPLTIPQTLEKKQTLLEQANSASSSIAMSTLGVNDE